MDKYANQKKTYRKSARGRAFQAWTNLLKRAGNSDGRNPSYKNVKLLITKKQFIEWAIPAYETWLKKNPNRVPSIDRIKESGHYELGNLQIIEWGENSRKISKNKNVHATKNKAWCCECKKYLPKSEFH